MVFKILAFAIFATFIYPAHLECPKCDCAPPQGILSNEWEPNSYVRRDEGFDVDTLEFCSCVCGVTVNNACSVTADCQENLICVGRAKKDDPAGLCRTRCGNDPHFDECGLYERCLETLDGSYFCDRMIKDCDSMVYIPVCATDGVTTQTFQSRCYMELNNIRLRDAKKTEFKKMSDRACAGDAVVINAS